MTTDTAINPVKGVNRREFLHYLLGASLGVLAVEACGLGYWYSLPRASLGRELFSIPVETVPQLGAIPITFREGVFWLSRVQSGLVALNAICVHELNYYKWVDLNHRFECGHCGSKFTADGAWINGPAARDLDRLKIQVVTPTGNRVTSDAGEPINIDAATSIIVDTRFILKQKRTERCGSVQFEDYSIYYGPCPDQP